MLRILRSNTGIADRYAVENQKQVSVLPHGRTLILVASYPMKRYGM